MSEEQGSESTVSRSKFIKEDEMAEKKEAPKKLSRKDFVKGAAAVAGAGALASCAPAAPPAATPAPAPTCPPAEECPPCVAAWMPEAWDEEADVVVIGTGYSGQASAIEAHDAGATVLMLEKAPEEFQGGNSRVCGQGFVAPPEVIWEDYFAYLKALTEGLGFPVDDEYITFYIEEGSKNVEWFQGMGAEVSPASTYGHTPGNWIPFFPNMPGADAIAQQEQYYKIGGEYGEMLPGGASSNWLFLEDQIKQRAGIAKMFETPAKRLVQDPVTKEVLGVVADSGGSEIYVKAKRAVCVCAGGWEYNQEMVRNFQHIPVLYSKGSPYNTGETIKMCWAAGADIVSMGGIAAPTGLSSGMHPELQGAVDVSQTPRGGSSITVGANNKRWRDEYRPTIKGIQYKDTNWLEGTNAGVGTEILDGVLVRERWPAPMYIILDEAARLSGNLFGSALNWMGWNRVVEKYEPSADNSTELEWGWMVQADTIAELATKIGREADPLFERVALEETVDRWNQLCAAGEDLDHGRTKNLTPMEVPPFYAIQCFPQCLNTQGGMRRNTNSQVLDVEGNPIPRLYSAGENGDVVWSLVYQCMSNVGAGCYGYGRVAGQNAAVEEAWDEA